MRVTAVLTIADAGGMPIVHGGEVVGAIASSGGQPAEDEAVCEAGLAAFVGDMSA